ncbi:hypothetical protein HNQ51_002882 [Inhella inkyongensis]|uniref:Uncharacterized protein n=1 Tax=Inhella inkyongensis TaxID=392593 RepID=A0A840S7B0_9BURK|nr:hypothetical protein [Inhella inkyongensis]
MSPQFQALWVITTLQAAQGRWPSPSPGCGSPLGYRSPGSAPQESALRLGSGPSLGAIA